MHRRVDALGASRLDGVQSSKERAGSKRRRRRRRRRRKVYSELTQ
jgi:hypothetical protein